MDKEVSALFKEALAMGEACDLKAHDIDRERILRRIIYAHFEKGARCCYVPQQDTQIKDSIAESIKATGERITAKYGDIDGLRSVQGYEALYNYVALHDFKREGAQVKTRVLSCPCGFVSFVDAFYSAHAWAVEGRYLPDYREIHEYIEAQGLKSAVYEKSGELRIKALAFKLFKNGALRVTFKDEAEAVKFCAWLEQARAVRDKARSFDSEQAHKEQEDRARHYAEVQARRAQIEAQEREADK
jgi:hypothetical protein